MQWQTFSLGTHHGPRMSSGPSNAGDAHRVDPDLASKRRADLKRSVEYHGHLCMGQVLGVHIAEAGMKAAGTDDPKHMIVVVENDRCIADALQILTGTRLGRRSMKLVDYGKMAATFLNQKTDEAYRVWVSGKVNELVGKPPSGEGKELALERLLLTPSKSVVSVCRVRLVLAKKDLPGKPDRTVRCTNCGEKVMDGKDIIGSEGPQCIACARGPYYEEFEGDDNEGGR